MFWQNRFSLQGLVSPPNDQLILDKGVPRSIEGLVETARLSFFCKVSISKFASQVQITCMNVIPVGTTQNQLYDPGS